MNLNNLPAEMRSTNNWVLVKLEPKTDGGFDKIPVGLSGKTTYKLSWRKAKNRLSFQVANHLFTEEQKLPRLREKYSKALMALLKSLSVDQAFIFL